LKTQNNMYDTIIIGAGIAGASIAYVLKQKKQKVLVLEKKEIASGGSGAAGAFVSPKIGKGGPLQTLTNEAFAYAYQFYTTHFPKYYKQTGLIRLPKDEEDAKRFDLYKTYNYTPFSDYNHKKIQSLKFQTPFDGFYFPEGGVCEATATCETMLTECEVKQHHQVEQLHYDGEIWHVDSYRTKKVVLATGHQSNLFDTRYMGIRGTWGERGDYHTSLKLTTSLHQSLSISAAEEGIIKIGATHAKNVKEPRGCDAKRLEGLLGHAGKLINIGDFELLQSHCGMRAGSKDYTPLVGRVINVDSMLKTYPKLLKGAKPPLTYIENLYIYNGLGGRGFVFAPLLAEMLSRLMLDNREVDSRVNPDRLFYKWCRKLHHNTSGV
jgi:tRNA 5-methylaminomethyl-2-thiouridine biosynthesis bifunctional protein